MKEINTTTIYTKGQTSEWKTHLLREFPAESCFALELWLCLCPLTMEYHPPPMENSSDLVVDSKGFFSTVVADDKSLLHQIGSKGAFGRIG